MATSLLDGLKALMTPDLLAAAARITGEPEGSVADGLGAASTSILAALAGKAGTPQAIGPFYELITSPVNDGSVTGDPRLAAVATAGSPLGAIGGRLLSSLFGSQLPRVSDLITRSAGLRWGTGASLLSMAAPLVLGVLGNKVRSGGLSPARLAGLLTSEREQIMRAAPAGLGSILGLTGLGREAAMPAAQRQPAAPGRSWLWPAVAALAILGVLWMLGRDRHPATVDETGAVGGMVGGAADTAAGGGDDILFRCGEQRVSVSHTGDRTVLSTGQGVFDLQQVESGSGARYQASGDPSTTFWNKGDRATVTVKGQPYPECSREP